MNDLCAAEQEAAFTAAAPCPPQAAKSPSTSKTRSPTACPHSRLDQEVVDFCVKEIKSRVACLAKQMDIASKHLKAYKKEIKYCRLEQEKEASSKDVQGSSQCVL